MATPTPAQQDRTVKMFSDVAGTPVEIIWYDAEYTILTTELGMYRIADKWVARVISKGRSVNLDCWFVTLSLVPLDN
jgi:hypothetical protein